MIRSAPFLFFFILVITKPVQAQKQGQERIDSLLTVLPKLKEDTNKVNLLNALSFAYYLTNPDEGVKIGRQSLALAEKLKWKKGIAGAAKAVGVDYAFGKGDFVNAQEFLLHSLKMEEELRDTSGIAACLVNLGFVYSSQPDYPKALDYYSQSMQLYTKLGNQKGIGANLTNMAIIYMNQADYARALEYSLKALKIYEALGLKSEITRVLGSIGVLYENQKDYKKTLEYYSSSLAMAKELGDKHFIAQNLGNMGGVYEVTADSGGRVLDELHVGDRNAALRLAKVYTDSAIAIDEELGDLERLKQFYKNLSDINKMLGSYKEALESYTRYSAVKDSLFNIEKDKKLTQKSMQYEFDKKEAADKAEQEKKDIQQRNIRNSIAGGLAGALIFLAVVYRQRNKIAREEKRSEMLLLNILPAETAKELKQTGATKAKDFEQVTVLFTDFRNFTTVSEQFTPQELVNEINYNYSAFDDIITKYGIEKIKTIGDSYMCAGGLPVANKTNAEDVVAAALEIRDFMLHEQQKREATGKPFFEIRIGCNSGPVVAGIVGIKKFAYDIWGDTVNIASRMESSGEPGKVNISGSTFQLVKDKFACTYRGKVEAKNKGLIDMYFVDHA